MRLAPRGLGRRSQARGRLHRRVDRAFATWLPRSRIAAYVSRGRCCRSNRTEAGVVMTGVDPRALDRFVAKATTESTGASTCVSASRRPARLSPSRFRGFRQRATRTARSGMRSRSAWAANHSSTTIVCAPPSRPSEGRHPRAALFHAQTTPSPRARARFSASRSHHENVASLSQRSSMRRSKTNYSILRTQE